MIGKINTVICGDCLEEMAKFPANSFDGIITDPPYGLGFMGKDWDTFTAANIAKKTAKHKPIDHKLQTERSASMHAGSYDYSRNAEFQQWFTVWAAECLRIAKPGAIMLCFGGTRTFHRLTCAIEDAGWEIRDCMMWLYGSGFPKSLNISKAIDKAKGAEREQLVEKKKDIFGGYEEEKTRRQRANSPESSIPLNASISEVEHITNPATDLAKFWDGYGTALKPAWEPICVAMKPLDGTFAQNAEKWGVAGLNIDKGRIKTNEDTSRKLGKTTVSPSGWKSTNRSSVAGLGDGRWPANVILDEEAAAMLDEQSGELLPPWGKASESKQDTSWFSGKTNSYGKLYRDSGGASRFFYCAKASRSERNAGLDGMEEKRPDDRSDVGKGIWTEKGTAKQTNHHPTVKPLKLMEYLCRLLKPPTEHPILLDPFTGSGTTLMAAINTGWDYVGIEKEPDYWSIAERRLAWAIKQRQGQKGLFK